MDVGLVRSVVRPSPKRPVTLRARSHDRLAFSRAPGDRTHAFHVRFASVADLHDLNIPWTSPLVLAGCLDCSGEGLVTQPQSQAKLKKWRPIRVTANPLQDDKSCHHRGQPTEKPAVVIAPQAPWVVE